LSIITQEDLVNLKLSKEKSGGFLVYKVATEKGTTQTYSPQKKSPFIYVRPTVYPEVPENMICVFLWDVFYNFLI